MTSMWNVSSRFASAIGNLRHHRAKIQSLTLDPRLFRRHQKSHECRPPAPLAVCLSEFNNLTQLTNTWFLIETSKHYTGTIMMAIPAPRRHAVVSGALRNSASLLQLVCAPTNVLLRDKVGGPQRLGVVFGLSSGTTCRPARGNGTSSLRPATADRVAAHNQTLHVLGK
jgi:hypothetical protein